MKVTKMQLTKLVEEVVSKKLKEWNTQSTPEDLEVAFARTPERFKDDLYNALQTVDEFKNLGMDQQGELTIKIMKLFDAYT